MSLDVELIIKDPIKKTGTGIFIRRDGANVELTVEELKAAFPDSEHIQEQEYETNVVYHGNITHNLNEMAHEAGLYEALWRPYKLKENYEEPEDEPFYEEEFEQQCTILAKEITSHLEKGLKELKFRPQYYKQFNPSNGWGDYEGLVEFTEKYLSACIKYPQAQIRADR